MPSYSIDTNNSPVEVDVSDTVVVAPSVSETITKTPLVVTAHPRNYSIVGDDIFTIKRNNDPDPWFISMLDNLISDSPLADDVSDLTSAFNNFEDSITKEVGEISGNQENIVYDLSVIKTSTDANAAGILNLDIVKVTADEATAISNSTIAAWQTDGIGGAWFDDKVSVVSNIAYSAAKSASTLTASINSQQDQIISIVGDITILEKQIDGKVETWFSEELPILVNGDIDPNVEPYKSWLTDNTMDIHTGDTYVYFEYDIVNPTKKNILITFRFALDTSTDTYEWYVFEDDLASIAYQQALDAQVIADSKIVTYYQSFPPPYTTPEDKLNGIGDIWLDSDDGNKMYRYDGTSWNVVDDTRIEATITRTDEAFVDVDGEARAKSSLSVDANGSIAGFVAESDGSTSKFTIQADEFAIVNSLNQGGGIPFSIDTTTNKIKFNGVVTFEGTPVDTALQPGDAAQDINTGVTTIDGGKITTNSINANKITLNTLWVQGVVASPQQQYNVSGYIPNIDPSGFMLNAKQDNGSYNYPNIYGAYIRGGSMYATTLDAVTINTGTLNADLINSGSLTNVIRGTHTVTSSNASGTGNLVVINGTSNVGNLGLYRNGILLISVHDSGLIFGSTSIWCTYMDSGESATYTVKTSTGTVATRCNMSITQLKK